MAKNMNDGGNALDGYPKSTSNDLAQSDDSELTKGPLKTEMKQAEALINLVLRGAKAESVMRNTIKQIREGQGGGPYPIGSTVKLNRACEAGAAGDVVSILRPNMGNTGTEKEVLKADGTTAIIPLECLGESIEDGGYILSPASGSGITGTDINQGEKEPADASGVDKSGSSTATINTNIAQGEKEPDDNAAAQKAGKSSPDSISPGQAVEAKREILQSLSMTMESEDSIKSYKLMNETKRMVESLRLPRSIGKIHSMIFGKKNFTMEQIKARVESEIAADPALAAEDDEDPTVAECGDDMMDDVAPFGGDDANMIPAESEDDDKDDVAESEDDDADDKVESEDDDAEVSEDDSEDDKVDEDDSEEEPKKEEGELDPEDASVKPAPGLKEAVSKSFKSIFGRMDEDVNKNLEGRRRRGQ